MSTGRVAYRKLSNGEWVDSSMPEEVRDEVLRCADSKVCEEGVVTVEIGGVTMQFQEEVEDGRKG